jgi:hypothetical protein
MKQKEQVLTRQLRRKGYSVREIAKSTQCSKSSISRWVCDIALTDSQIRRLKSNQDRGRARAAQHFNSPKQKWKRIRDNIATVASHEIKSARLNGNLKIIGAILYWAEGYKATRNMVSFSNSDPAMIKIMISFFKEVCGVSTHKFRGVVHIHPHLNTQQAEKYWSMVSGIPLRQFHKTQTAISRSSKQKKDTLPLGTFNIVISDTCLRSKIEGWLQSIRQWAVSSAG